MAVDDSGTDLAYVAMGTSASLWFSVDVDMFSRPLASKYVLSGHCSPPGAASGLTASLPDQALLIMYSCRVLTIINNHI